MSILPPVALLRTVVRGGVKYRSLASCARTVCRQLVESGLGFESDSSCVIIWHEFHTEEDGIRGHGLMLINEGVVLREVYEVERFLGEGAFAKVYRVKHKYLGRQAMKVFKQQGTSVDEIENMLSEALILSRIGHPNIVRVFDAGVLETDVGQCGYFTMEYVAGGSLETFWRSHGTNLVRVSDAVEIIRQVCQGLAVAHAENPPIVHRDIKPQNILVGYDAIGIRIRVTDFGLAKQVNPLTFLASARGTRGFKPPEFHSNVDSCSGDVWGIGATLYLLLTDRLPYPGVAEKDVLDGKCWDYPYVPASRFNVAVDANLDAMLSRALALKASERYSNAGMMLEDLRRWKPQAQPQVSRNQKSTDKSKSAIDGDSVPARQSAEEMVTEAIRLSKCNRIAEAADLLEEALNLSQELRDKHQYRLGLWRRGVLL